jgi:regulation of enolase protein 1 (concanavalin A-like superfamily)
MQPYPIEGPLTIRLTAEPGRYPKVTLQYKNDSEWIKFREITGWLCGRDMNIDVGVMACSPGDKGFRVEFWDILAQDYSELAYEKGLAWGTLNPNLNPDALVGS